jgi:hypothetical protein
MVGSGGHAMDEQAAQAVAVPVGSTSPPVRPHRSAFVRLRAMLAAALTVMLLVGGLILYRQVIR